MLRAGQYEAINGDYYATPKEAWGFRYATRPGKPRKRAEQFLREHAALFRLSPTLGDLECVSVRESLGATHVVFRQLVHGARIHRGLVSVHLDRRGRVYLAKNRATPEQLTPEGPSFELGEQRALALARAFLRAAGKGPLRQSGPVEKLWFPVRDYLAPAYRVRLLRKRPAETWDVLVHAVTGELLWKYDNLSLARARIFDPSPVAVLGDHTALLAEGALSQDPRRRTRTKPPPSETYSTVRLTGLDGSGHLQGRRVRVESVRHPRRVRRQDGDFLFHARDPRFEHVMAYFHVNEAIRYLERLGYRGTRRIFREPLRVDPRAFGDDNAFYDPDSRTLVFGTGQVDEAEDAETIFHEFGHALQDAICRDFGLSVEAAAMGEGFGDYFAASFFEKKKPARYRKAVMAWDGLFIGLEEGRKPPCMRSLDNELTYEDFKPYSDVLEHENGQIWSATLWDVRELLGRRRADVVIVESHFQLDAFATFARGARAILDANQNLFGGRQQRALRNVFLRRKIRLSGP
jgi:Zn-dependent metalloprotease